MSTDFRYIHFDPEQHRYFFNQTELTGVTKFLKQFQQPFDQQGVASKVAAKQGKTVEQVIAEWEKKGKEGREKGTFVHDMIRRTLVVNPVQSDFLETLSWPPEVNAFDKFWRIASVQYRYSEEHIEWVIGDVEFKLAGTVDALMQNTETGLYHLMDWKTGKFDLSNQYQKLKYPFPYLDDCQLNVYSLQLSLYRLMIERNTPLKLGDSYLVHLNESGSFTVHRAVDLREKITEYMPAASH